MNTLISAVLAASLVTGAGGASTSGTPPSTEALGSIRSADAAIEGTSDSRFWLVRVNGSLKRFDTFDALPESDETFVVARRNGRVIAVMRVASSASGDWLNTYTHFFDRMGHTMAFRRQSGFFNGQCIPDVAEPLHETTWLYFDSRGNLISRTDDLRDNAEKHLSEDDCTFYYRHPYDVSPSRRALARSAGLERWLR